MSLCIAAKGYDIVILCRDKSKGEQTATELMKINTAIHIETFVADLSDLAAVQKATKAIATRYPVIDRLINNAGYYPGVIEYVGDIERTFLASHLGHALLTQGLMQSLKRSAEARIVNVSSSLHSQGSIARFFKRTKGISLIQAYADAKLANILFTKSLAKHLAPNVVTFALHPGVVRSNFAKGTSGLFTVFINLFRPFFISAEQGAATSVYLTDVDIQKVKPFTSQYFVDKKPKKVNHKDVTDQNAATLWDKSMEIITPYMN